MWKTTLNAKRDDDDWIVSQFHTEWNAHRTLSLSMWEYVTGAMKMPATSNNNNNIKKKSREAIIITTTTKAK